jgi:hypothetical protein
MDFEPDMGLLRATQYHEWHWVEDDELEKLQEAQGLA